MNKVLIIVGDASETVDTLYPYFRVAEDGYRAVIAGPEARMYHMVLHEVPPSAKIPWDITEERPGYHIQADNVAGLDLGRQVATYVWPKTQAYFDGTATVR